MDFCLTIAAGAYLDKQQPHGGRTIVSPTWSAYSGSPLPFGEWEIVSEIETAAPSDILHTSHTMDKLLADPYWFLQLPATHIPGSTSFRVVPFMFRAEGIFEGATASMTIATQCSLDYIHEIAAMAETADARISVAVLAMKSIGISHALLSRLRQCSSHIAKRVDIHLVMPDGKQRYLAEYNELGLTDRGYDDVIEAARGHFDDQSCKRVLEKGLGAKQLTDQRYEAKGGLVYPVNLLRNVALQHVTAAHVMVLDVDLAVSKDLAVEHARAHDELTRMGLDMSKVAIVVPCESVMIHGCVAQFVWAALSSYGISFLLIIHRSMIFFILTSLQHLRRSTVLCAFRQRVMS